jgi:hypothetical protein
MLAVAETRLYSPQELSFAAKVYRALCEIEREDKKYVHDGKEYPFEDRDDRFKYFSLIRFHPACLLTQVNMRPGITPAFKQGLIACILEGNRSIEEYCADPEVEYDRRSGGNALLTRKSPSPSFLTPQEHMDHAEAFLVRGLQGLPVSIAREQFTQSPAPREMRQCIADMVLAPFQASRNVITELAELDAPAEDLIIRIKLCALEYELRDQRPYEQKYVRNLFDVFGGTSFVPMILERKMLGLCIVR